MFICTHIIPPPTRSTLFPYTTLFRSLGFETSTIAALQSGRPYNITTGTDDNGDGHLKDRPAGAERNAGRSLDRKSTRLNSSHITSSYAVVCLKKKIEQLQFLFP